MLKKYCPLFFLCILAGFLFSCSMTDVQRVVETVFPPFPPQKESPAPAPAPAPQGSGWHKNITATYFDISNYRPPKTAWNDEDPLTENPYYLALPCNDRVPGLEDYGPCKNRWLEIICVKTNKRAYGQWEDVGPWFVNDTDYVFDPYGTTRPFAERQQGQMWNIYRQKKGSGTRAPRKILNDAGIDLSPKLAGYLGLGGKGKVHWRFVTRENVPQGPWTARISTSKPHYKQKMYQFSTYRYQPWEHTTTLLLPTGRL